MAKLRNNLTTKILSVIAAIVLWMYVMNEQNPPLESSFTVPLEIRNLAINLVAPDAPETVRIKLRGPRSIIAGVSSQDLKAYVDAKGFDAGRHSVKVQVVVPASLDVVDINPDKFTLVIDQVIKRQLPVEVRLSGTAAEGNTVSKTVVSPTHITIAGPQRLVEAVDKAIANVNLTGRSADFTTAVPLVLVGADGKEIQGLTLYSDKVNVSVTLVRAPVTKTVEVKAILYNELPAGVTLKRLTTEPGQVEITGPAEVVNNLSYIYTQPVNVGGIHQDTTLEAKLQIPEEVSVNTNSVNVTITVQTRN